MNKKRKESVPIAANTRKNPKKIAKVFFRIGLVSVLIVKYHSFFGLPGAKLPEGSLYQGTISTIKTPAATEGSV